jgi:hypothetical protein
VDLEDGIITELELNTFNSSSIRKLDLQIAREVDQELNSYDRHFSDYTPGYTHSMVDDEETSGVTSSTTDPDEFYDDEDNNSFDSENWSSW